MCLVEKTLTLINILGCDLDTDNYMLAMNLRGCLTALGGNGTNNIEYIETHYGYRNYLDNICSSIRPTLVFDRVRTEEQADMCKDGNVAFMYPSNCDTTWLEGCENNCTFENFEGFYCRGKCIV